MQKPPPKWLCPPQFCLGLGDDFEGPFAPEGYEVTPVIILPGLGTRLGYIAK